MNDDVDAGFEYGFNPNFPTRVEPGDYLLHLGNDDGTSRITCAVCSEELPLIPVGDQEDRYWIGDCSNGHVRILKPGWATGTEAVTIQIHAVDGDPDV